MLKGRIESVPGESSHFCPKPRDRGNHAARDSIVRHNNRGEVLGLHYISGVLALRGRGGRRVVGCDSEDDGNLFGRNGIDITLPQLVSDLASGCGREENISEAGPLMRRLGCGHWRTFVRDYMKNQDN
jgi:hypothetical protein